jgi:predicted MPP superfamily phosphohydrolase
MTALRITRRRFVALTGGSLAAAAGVGLYTWRIEPHWLEIVHRPLPIRDLPAALIGRTLVQLSDIHVGHRVDDNYVIETFGRVAELKPDVVVLTGDLTSYHPDVLPQVSRVYQHFPRGRLATLAIPGNHDYGPNWSHPEMAEAVVNAVTPLGITVLRNEVREVAGLQIAGLDDLWANRFEPALALASLDRTQPALVLSHNPDTVDLPVWGHYEGWILSGHTHGGQCKPPFLPPPLLPVRNRRYTAGEFELAGNRRLYINRGVGHLTRVRFNVRPEVTVFELGTTS